MTETMQFVCWVLMAVLLIVAIVGFVFLIIGDHKNDKAFREAMERVGKDG